MVIPTFCGVTTMVIPTVSMWETSVSPLQSHEDHHGSSPPWSHDRPSAKAEALTNASLSSDHSPLGEKTRMGCHVYDMYLVYLWILDSIICIYI